MPSSRGFSQPRFNVHLFCLLHWQAGSLPLVPSEKPSQKPTDRQTHPHTKSQNGQQTYVNSKQQTFRRLHWRNVDDLEFGNDFLNKLKAQSIKKKRFDTMNFIDLKVSPLQNILSREQRC